VIWSTATRWGIGISALQALALVNAWPLQWMTYDTAVPSGTFLVQQALVVVAAFFGFAVFFTLSFAAAETLTRRAFGHHPQLWRIWHRGPGSSREIAGRTAAGYLLVPIFLAYEVGLYLFATRTLGWWSPSETLVHPDVLATYVPWFTAIANSLQAGFWEECLFRAVPIAGAALIGDRYGHRRQFIVLAFIVQAIVFGGGHAQYPAQPSFARPVELLLPSIGFGLLYLYFGLLPAIVLHFTFDVVWFALPIFLADAPGIRVHQAMVVVMTNRGARVESRSRSVAGHSHRGGRGRAAGARGTRCHARCALALPADAGPRIRRAARVGLRGRRRGPVARIARPLSPEAAMERACCDLRGRRRRARGRVAGVRP
jgi:hypothetical protein